VGPVITRLAVGLRLPSACPARFACWAGGGEAQANNDIIAHPSTHGDAVGYGIKFRQRFVSASFDKSAREHAKAD